MTRLNHDFDDHKSTRIPIPGSPAKDLALHLFVQLDPDPLIGQVQAGSALQSPGEVYLLQSTFGFASQADKLTSEYTGLRMRTLFPASVAAN